MNRRFSCTISSKVATRITALTLPVALAVAVGAGAFGAGCSGGDGNGEGSGADAAGNATGDVDASGAMSARDGSSAADGAARARAGGEGSDAGATEDGAVADDASRDALAEAASSDAGTDAPVGLGLDCGDAGAPNAGPAPVNLGCTGLYSSWPSRTLAASVMPFDPGLHLWSDGATKARYIELPPGAKIDTADMDEWNFPVGTKLWKEFSLGGKKVETRFMWKQASGAWLKTTYQWSSDQQTATELTTGAKDVWGTGYEIPDQYACTTCHEGRLDYVLGFEAIGLSSPAASGLTMAKLVQLGLVTDAPTAPIVIPGNATEQAALGWLHANCGTSCHSGSDNAYARSTDLWMRLTTKTLATVQGTDTYTRTVGVTATFKPTDGTVLQRIKPHDPAHSCVTYRDSRRDQADEGNQMPPIGTHVIDSAGVQLVTNWINSMP
jgi:hypothetical protein